MNTRERTWEIVEAARHGDVASRAFDIGILSLIFVNVIAVIIGSVQSVQDRWSEILEGLETVSVFVFTAEYIARLWSCTAESRYRGPIRGRVRLAFRAMMIVDLLAILPAVPRYRPAISSSSASSSNSSCSQGRAILFVTESHQAGVRG